VTWGGESVVVDLVADPVAWIEPVGSMQEGTQLVDQTLGLVGAQLSTQASVVDLGTTTPTKLVMSNALETTFGGSQ
jgi:hypothetical protein